MQPRRRATVTVLALAVTLFLGGCDKRSEYTIGAVLASTGSGAAYAEDIRKGIDLGLEEINAAGGVQGLPLKLLYEDSGSDPARARAAAEKLIGEPTKVTAIIGGVLSSETLEIAPLAEEKKVLLLSPASSSPSITGAGDYIFRVYPSDVVEGTIMADYMLNVLKRSRIMIVAVDNEYGKGLKTVFAKRYRAVPNREIVEVANFRQGNTDWAEIIDKMEAHGPDGLYLVGYPQEMLSFLEALKVSAASGVQVLASRSFDVEMLKIPAAQGVIFPRDLFEPARTERATTFAAAYRGKYGSEPTIWAANGYDAVHLLAEAMESGGANPDKIRAWLDAVTEWKGASGIITFDPQGDVEKLPEVSIVHEGSFMSVKEYQELAGKS